MLCSVSVSLSLKQTTATTKPANDHSFNDLIQKYALLQICFIADSLQSKKLEYQDLKFRNHFMIMEHVGL